MTRWFSSKRPARRGGWLTGRPFDFILFVILREWNDRRILIIGLRTEQKILRLAQDDKPAQDETRAEGLHGAENLPFSVASVRCALRYFYSELSASAIAADFSTL
jgi:hypothetical protein